MIESVITVKPFRFWCQKVLPLVYDDSLSYYELLCKVVDYINGLLTDDTNVIAQVNELTTFVNDYFTNLDVQEEINNKLDAMVDNGQLDEVISHYVDPYIAAQNTRITNFEATVNSHLSTQDDDINVLEARMDTFASLPTGSLSTDADAELVDIRVGADGTTYSSAGNAVRGQVSELKTKINTAEETYSGNECSVPFVWSNYTSSDETGLPTVQSNIRISGSRIAVPKNCAIEVTRLTTAAGGMIYLFDTSDTFIRAHSLSTYNASTPVRIGRDDVNLGYIRACIFYQDNRDVSPSDADSTYTFKFRFISDVDANAPSNIKKTSKNLIDVSKSTTGYYFDSASGSMSASSSYDTTDFIPTDGNDKIVFRKRFRKLLAYDKYKLPIVSSYDTNGQNAGYVYTVPENAAYVRVSYFHSDTQIQANYGDTLNAYTAYKTQVEEGIHLSETMLSDIIQSSVLTGKKWVACGDSFTQGDFNGLDPSEYKYSDGVYAGLPKVYPYVIGLRTGATIVNEAISGSTMAYVNGNIYEFSKPNGRYTQIPADADYITLYFGINDSHHNIPIGNITDAVNTTFYGAWNIVMQYLIANHPNAKIGIIISNGCDTIDYPNAEIAIAKKYGVAYLDMNSDYKVPILFRVNGKPDTDASIIQANYAHFRVSETNGHPNVAMHEYESTIIQKWLESI